MKIESFTLSINPLLIIQQKTQITQIHHYHKATKQEGEETPPTDEQVVGEDNEIEVDREGGIGLDSSSSSSQLNSGSAASGTIVIGWNKFDYGLMTMTIGLLVVLF